MTQASIQGLNARLKATRTKAFLNLHEIMTGTDACMITSTLWELLFLQSLLLNGDGAPCSSIHLAGGLLAGVLFICCLCPLSPGFRAPTQ